MTQQSKRRNRKTGTEEIPRIWLGYGKLLRRLRERAGMTQLQLAERINYSEETVRSVEGARRPAKRAFTMKAEEALGAEGFLEVLQDDVDLAKLPQFFLDFAAIEAEAVSRYEFEVMLVPGLLQTEEYMRAVFATLQPALDDDIIEQHAEARVGRQRLLYRTSSRIEFSFVLWEPVLRCQVGGSEVMKRQLQQLLELGGLPNVEIQVMPLANTTHPGLSGPFVLLETDDHQRMAYFESQDVPHGMTDPRTVSTFGLRYGKLRSQALNIEESAEFIERVLGEL